MYTSLIRVGSNISVAVLNIELARPWVFIKDRELKSCSSVMTVVCRSCSRMRIVLVINVTHRCRVFGIAWVVDVVQRHSAPVDRHKGVFRAPVSQRWSAATSTGRPDPERLSLLG